MKDVIFTTLIAIALAVLLTLLTGGFLYFINWAAYVFVSLPQPPWS